MDFRPYIDELITDLPPTQATRQIADELVAEMEQKYTSLVDNGMAEEQAVRQILFSFGAYEGLRSKLLERKLYAGYARFLQRYPLMRRSGFLGFIIVPLVCLILMFSLDQKLAALTTWIISIIVFATYLICLEYTHYHYQKRILGIGKKLSQQLMEWLRQPLQDNIETPRKDR